MCVRRRDQGCTRRRIALLARRARARGGPRETTRGVSVGPLGSQPHPHVHAATVRGAVLFSGREICDAAFTRWRDLVGAARCDRSRVSVPVASLSSSMFKCLRFRAFAANIAEEPMADRDLTGCTLGEFVLVDKIGEGGYGAVYRSEQPLLRRHVVVKVLRKDDSAAEQRFLREARLASRFDHPFAAHVYAFGVAENEGVLWIAMELVQGITLAKWLEQHGPMPLEQFVPFFEAVADAVHAAHECGIVHRDVKPSNVMVVERGSRLLPKLLDFGIAKSLDQGADNGSAERRSSDDDPSRPHESSITADILPPPSAENQSGVRATREKRPITRTGAACGSRAYMSPEQWSDARAVGPASDVYALGVVAYEALTGRLPYIADSSDEYFQLHRYGEIPTLGAGFSKDLDRVIGCALAKFPAHRYRSALEMAAEFREALQVQPREQLRSLAKVWNDRARSPAHLLRGGDLLHTPSETIGELERAFVAESHRRTTRVAWVRRLIAASAAALAIGAVWYRGRLETRAAQQLADLERRAAQQVTEATVTQAELEQGRSALLHNEPEARHHLAEAYRRDPAPATAFMLARSLEPRLAEQGQFTSSSGRMWSATFSADGATLATTDDNSAALWNAQTNQLLMTLPHGDTVYESVFSSDGRRLITAGGDGIVRIWDSANGTLIQQLHRDGIKPRFFVVARSPNDKLIAAIGLGGAATYVWNAASGAVVAELPHDASDGPSLAFSSDGRWLATAGESARVFSTTTWAELRIFRRSRVRVVSWDPGGPRLLTGSANGDASIWSIPTGTRLHHLRDVGEPVEAVAFSPDGQLVVAATRDGAELVWDASTGTLRSAVNHLRSRILAVDFDSSSSLVAAASASGYVAIADARSGFPISLLDGPRNVVRTVRFDPSSRRVAGASWDGAARVWGATPLHRRWTSSPVSDDCGLVTSLQPDGRFVAVGCREHPTRIWDTAHDQLIAELPSVTSAGGDFASAYPAVSAAGERAAIARGTAVEVYELPSGRLLRRISLRAAVNTVAFAASGRDVVIGAVDGSLVVARDSGAELALPTAGSGIDAAGFLPDGRIVAADAGRRVRFYAVTGEILAELDASARVRMLRMSSNGHRLITVPGFMGKAAAPELWDVGHYQRIAVLDGHAQVYSARFVGEQVLTAWGDGLIRLWDGISGQLRKTYRGGSRFLVDVTLSSDGAMIVGGGGDGVLRFWDAASARPLWTMQAHRSHLVGVRVEGNEVITRGFSGDISRWVLPSPERVFEACRHHDRCAIVAK